ncbi:choice-of-anchor I family protein [Microbacterium sediminis]|uniref:choice-of-anchor I family protein n=1 Tax=Microbacterium sediminis TaxID=904291 RepID=UPI00107234D4|nr:choice-of-anchor I family protein [Microbacterium sediminis]QBR75125.1 bifunctional metallophosphatase/5'-nucleotidase [Microbacterium sediminis]
MSSSFLRRATGAVAAAAAVCAFAIVPATAANAVIVDEPIVDSIPNAPFQIVPTGTFETGIFDQGASEIVQTYGNRIFSVNAAAGSVFVIDMSNPAALEQVGEIASEGGVANSVAVRADGLGAVALEDAADKTAPGRILFFNANTLETLGAVTVGSLPDMVTISPDGKYALVANEGEPNDAFTVDPEGSVSVIALPGSLQAPRQADVRTADFHAFEDAELPEGMRDAFGPILNEDLPRSTNWEPEYITVQGGTAYAALQEANAVAVIDLATATVTDLWGLGYTDRGLIPLDASDHDPEGAPTINIATYPGLHGIPMPDGIQSYVVGGQTYLVTANEGDAREWGDYAEPARVKNLADDGYGPLCDDLAAYADDAQLGRLEVTTEMGFNEAEGCYDELYTFGSRSFSIYTADGDLVFDSGAQFEELTKRLSEETDLVFNAGHDDNELESRSDAKGVEPENLTIGEVDGRTYAFIGFERLSGVVAYDITDPVAPTYVSYINNRDFGVSLADEYEDLEEAGATPEALADLVKSAGDLGPEGLDFVAAANSPTGKPLLVVGNEVTGSTTVYTLDDGTTEVQVLTINDFHGRIEANGDEAGAAVLAGAVAEYRDANPNTIFASAGDNIGASTFTSFIADDEPTIDALSAAGLDVSAVGNHEFDQGFDDLTDRVIPSYGGEEFALGANVYLKGTKTPALREYAIKEVGGVRIGFIGTVTSDTSTLVSPAGIADIEFGDQLEAANRVAAQIADQTDAIVLLAHSGPSGSDCATISNEQSEYGDLIRGASSEIDAIVSGHTHLLYDCEIAGRPVIQAHQYGTTLGALDIVVDSTTNELRSIAGSTVDLVADDTEEPLFPADPEVQQIVDAASAEADVLGSVEVGKISGDILRGGDPAGSDRGVESTMGNLVADVYLWATSEYENYGGAEPAQIALMNPGGLRDDLLYGEDGTVTYADVAAVQPFGNTLVTLGLTGAQLEQVLEEQWQPGNERPKLHLGVSEGFSYEYIDDAPAGEHIVSMSYLGEPIDPADEFLIVTNSFLASGGDGFTTLAEGTGTADSGLIDLSATVDYFEEHQVVDPAPLGRAIVWTGAEPTPAPTTPAPTTPGTDEGEAFPAPDPDSLTDANRGGLTAPDTVAAGGTFTMTVPNAEPGQRVGVWLFSDPVSLGQVTVSADRTVTVTLPADVPPGEHRVAVVDEAGNVLGWTEITVTGLGVTGGEVPWGLALGALGLVVAGGVMLVIRRRTAAPVAA